MNQEKQPLLLDPNITPTDEIIAKGLGKANKAYIKFIAGLDHNEISLMGWRYYNDGKAWLNKGEYKWITKRGTEMVKPLFWLSIWDCFFRVAFFFSEKIRDELLALPISQEAKEIIKKVEPIVFDISDDKLICAIYTLAQFRKDNI